MAARPAHRAPRRLARPKILTAAVVAGLVASSAGAAYADDISNNLDASIDAVAEVMALTAGGATGSTTLYVTPTNEPNGKNGCNLTGGSTLTLSLGSSSTAVATVSPSSVTFTSCGATQAVTVTPVGAGTATVSASQTSNTTDGTFNLAPVTFTVNVAPATPANTAPQLSITGVAPGAEYELGSVPAATCSVTDAEDGPSTFPASLSAVAGPYAADGIGSRTASCSYTDGGGLTASASVTFAVVDLSAPAISYTLTPATPDGDAGWYRGSPTLVWHVSEPQSPSSLVLTGCVDQAITADQAATDYSCAATSAGGSAAAVTVTIARDATAPTVAGVVTSAAIDVAGTPWYRDTARVEFSADDALSGLADGSPAPASVTLGAGVGQTASATATDRAGNTANATVAGIHVDASVPTVQLTCPAAPVVLGDPASASWTASDTGSGLAGPATGTVALDSSAVGTRTASAPVALDNVGHTSAVATCQYSVVYDFAGFFQPIDNGGVLNRVKAGSAVPVKFSLAGDQGLGILAGTPTVTPITCTAGATIDTLETVSTATTSGLKYDATADQYNYTWKTVSSFAGSCQRLTVRLVDGTVHTALFTFTK